MNQYRALELTQLRPGFETELVPERLPHFPVHLERLGLATGLVEREHQLAAQSLAERMLGHELLELADQLGAPAGSEVGVDPLLQRLQAQFLQPRDLLLRKRLVAELVEGRPLPQGERCAQRLGVAGRPSFVEQALEHLDVELVGLDAQDVATPSGQKPPIAESAPKPQDVLLKNLRSRRGRTLTPERVDETLAGDDLVPVQKEQREQRSMPSAAEWDDVLAVGRLKRAQDSELHLCRPIYTAVNRRGSGRQPAHAMVRTQNHQRGKEPFMNRSLKTSIALAIVLACAAVPATVGAASAGKPTVSVLKVFATCGAAPSVDRLGQVSNISGQLRDAAGNLIGGWRWQCTYLGGYGTKKASHFCKFAATFGSRGTIFSEGGIAFNSDAVQWNAVTGGTGSFRGVFGAARIVNLNKPTTPTTYYLIRQ